MAATASPRRAIVEAHHATRVKFWLGTNFTIGLGGDGACPPTDPGAPRGHTLGHRGAGRTLRHFTGNGDDRRRRR